MNFESKQTKEQLTQHDIHSLISALDRKLSDIVEGSDGFLLSIAAARLALRNLKRFF